MKRNLTRTFEEVTDQVSQQSLDRVSEENSPTEKGTNQLYYCYLQSGVVQNCNHNVCSHANTDIITALLKLSLELTQYSLFCVMLS